MVKQFWLMKVEPDVYTIDDLKRDKTTNWEGVRNYKARNYMRDSMQVGDEVLFYASNADPSGVTGLAIPRTGNFIARCMPTITSRTIRASSAGKVPM